MSNRLPLDCFPTLLGSLSGICLEWKLRSHPKSLRKTASHRLTEGQARRWHQVKWTLKIPSWFPERMSLHVIAAFAGDGAFEIGSRAWLTRCSMEFFYSWRILCCLQQARVIWLSRDRPLRVIWRWLSSCVKVQTAQSWCSLLVPTPSIRIWEGCLRVLQRHVKPCVLGPWGMFKTPNL